MTLHWTGYSSQLSYGREHEKRGTTKPEGTTKPGGTTKPEDTTKPGDTTKL